MVIGVGAGEPGEEGAVAGLLALLFFDDDDLDLAILAAALMATGSRMQWCFRFERRDFRELA
jgi:hypothetical protein